MYAYNNALFTEQDWTGIRMLQDSIKETDLMKIGRFGLGFKSVFHMTGMSESTIYTGFTAKPLRKIASQLQLTLFVVLQTSFIPEIKAD